MPASPCRRFISSTTHGKLSSRLFVAVAIFVIDERSRCWCSMERATLTRMLAVKDVPNGHSIRLRGQLRVLRGRAGSNASVEDLGGRYRIAHGLARRKRQNWGNSKHKMHDSPVVGFPSQSSLTTPNVHLVCLSHRLQHKILSKRRWDTFCRPQER